MRQSFEWFHGANRLGLPLYDFSTAGCRDGLEASGMNENQGAESTVSFLLALLTLLDLAGAGADGVRPLRSVTSSAASSRQSSEPVGRAP